MPRRRVGSTSPVVSAMNDDGDDDDGGGGDETVSLIDEIDIGPAALQDSNGDSNGGGGMSGGGGGAGGGAGAGAGVGVGSTSNGYDQNDAEEAEPATGRVVTVRPGRDM